MTLDLVAVAREAWARWRQDRGLLLPVAGLLLFVPQWAVLLLVPDAPQGIVNAKDPAAMRAFADAAHGWAEMWVPLMLAALLIAQWGRLALIALYVGGGDRSTVGNALARAGLLLLRYIFAELLVSIPLGAATLVGLAMPPLLAVIAVVAIYVEGRTLLVGPALLMPQPTGAVRAIVTSWRWTRGNGAGLALLSGALMLGPIVLLRLVKSASDQLVVAHLGNPVVIAALDAVAAAIAAAAMLALAMSVGVLYRRLAR